MFHLFPNFKSKILLDRVLGEPNIYQNLVDFTRTGDFTLMVSDYEDLKGVTHNK